MENEETLGKICPIMSSQSSLVYCKKDCAWFFSDVIFIAGEGNSRIDECVLMSVLRNWINSNT